MFSLFNQCFYSVLSCFCGYNLQLNRCFFSISFFVFILFKYQISLISNSFFNRCICGFPFHSKIIQLLFVKFSFFSFATVSFFCCLSLCFSRFNGFFCLFSFKFFGIFSEQFRSSYFIFISRNYSFT